MPDNRVLLTLDDGRSFVIDAERLKPQADGTYRVGSSPPTDCPLFVSLRTANARPLCACKLGTIARYSMMFANPLIFTMLRPANET